jgi:hypothetical protein
VGWAVTLLVLVTLVALAAASFFPNMLTALMVLVAIPIGLVLGAFIGAGYAVFAIGLLAVFAAVVHTISDTMRLLLTTKRRRRRRPPAALAERGAATRRSDRSRIAAWSGHARSSCSSNARGDEIGSLESARSIAASLSCTSPSRSNPAHLSASTAEAFARPGDRQLPAVTLWNRPGVV